MRRWLYLFIGFALILGACSETQNDQFVNAPTELSALQEPQPHCGDGTCNGPENATNCPIDCSEQGALSTLAVPPSVAQASNEVPPLYFFYAIHAHGSDEKLPYDDPGWQNLNPQIAENMIAAIEDIAEVLDTYGVKGTWEVLPATSQGLCSYQGEDHIFHRLIMAGHEVGTHAHRIEDIRNSYQALNEYCSIEADTTSGFIAQINSFDLAEVQAAMTLSLQASADLGITIGTTNLAPSGDRNPFAELCDTQIGPDNSMWSQSGNLMFPWRPDMVNKDVCAHSDEGPMLLIDHVSIEWIKLPGQEGVPDVLTDQNFNQLKNWFDGALQYMQEERPQRVAVWGFVTHITEYAVGSKAENPLDPEALAALDRFLAYVDAKRIEGKIVYATANEIANLFLKDQ
jgi:hypothetical protein